MYGIGIYLAGAARQSATSDTAKVVYSTIAALLSAAVTMESVQGTIANTKLAVDDGKRVAKAIKKATPVEVKTKKAA